MYMYMYKYIYIYIYTSIYIYIYIYKWYGLSSKLNQMDQSVLYYIMLLTPKLQGPKTHTSPRRGPEEALELLPTLLCLLMTGAIDFLRGIVGKMEA